MRLGMTSIKKYIPIIATLSLGLVVLISQVFFKGRDINASPSKMQNKLKLHYENNFKNIEFESNGKKISLKDSKAPVVILNFWASWCIPCLEEFPSLVSLRKKYKSQNVVIIGVNTDEPDSYSDAKKIMEKYKINFPIIFDKKSELVSKFKISAIPISIVFEKGKVVEISNGAKDFYAGEFLEKLDTMVQ